MRTIEYISVIVFAGVLASITVCHPKFLGENKFLLEYVNHEYINSLIVIVTVSFVSVTQIHLEYSRIERRFKTQVFSKARREVNAGAAILITLLFLSLPLVIVKSEYITNTFVQSTAHSLALLALVVSFLIMYDFIKTVYVLAAEEPVEGDDNNAA